MRGEFRQSPRSEIEEFRLPSKSVPCVWEYLSGEEQIADDVLLFHDIHCAQFLYLC